MTGTRCELKPLPCYMSYNVQYKYKDIKDGSHQTCRLLFNYCWLQLNFKHWKTTKQWPRKNTFFLFYGTRNFKTFLPHHIFIFGLGGLESHATQLKRCLEDIHYYTRVAKAKQNKKKPTPRQWKINVLLFSFCKHKFILQSFIVIKKNYRRVPVSSCKTTVAPMARTTWCGHECWFTEQSSALEGFIQPSEVSTYQRIMKCELALLQMLLSLHTQKQKKKCCSNELKYVIYRKIESNIFTLARPRVREARSCSRVNNDLGLLLPNKNI